ncbi:MAG: Serine/threonine-protein phosphatase 2A activator 1 [Sarea resinae]|nr:MAG: Serine/threonine-protein phosphatase 2A activator 1 [Sarea resinae]
MSIAEQSTVPFSPLPSSTSSSSSSSAPSLQALGPSESHVFITPAKRINDGQDVTAFLTSKAYHDLITFLLQLNASMFPCLVTTDGAQSDAVQTWELGSPAIITSDIVKRLRELLSRLEERIDEAPPDMGPRRFGNVSFRKWYQLIEEALPQLLSDCLPAELLSRGKDHPGGVTAKDELHAYLMGSFGSAQRLDYGTGHELSFLAFLGCIWKLGGFAKAEPGVEERGIVLGVFEPYLHLVRRLIKTYTLEPAGSHGVWGLDDHSFIPYIFGSAQFAPPMTSLDHLPAEGSLPSAPDPAGVSKANIVERERGRNMYFAAVGFIYDVKKGPFWEHSPILYDISGVRAGWAKINKGMIKMYNAEVLSKFPVVQHFPFGSLFKWEQDPNAIPPPSTAHTSSQPSAGLSASDQASHASLRAPRQESTKAPWASSHSAAATPAPSSTASTGATAAPWARQAAAPSAAVPDRGNEPSTRAPWASQTAGRSPAGLSQTASPPMRAPWADSRAASTATQRGMSTTEAPWAKSPGQG